MKEITCENCGACCKGWEIMTCKEDKVPEEMLDESSFVMVMTGRDHCVALKKRKCSIYENRPKVCREFEMGGFQCLQKRKEYRID